MRWLCAGRAQGKRRGARVHESTTLGDLVTRQARVTTEEAVDWLSLYISGASSTDMQTYGGGLLEELRSDGAPAFFYFIRRLMELGDMRGVDVLDVGCGFGWISAAIAMLGAKSVTANDVRGGMTRAVAERTAALRIAGLPLDVVPLLGDICELDLPERSFDAIVSSEAIEHIHDLDASMPSARHF